jgi:ABC-type bacteriocin/lantibiotic exporter with double-glycine peptidase domain
MVPNNTSSKILLGIKLWAHLTKMRKKQLFMLFGLMVLTSFTEVISIGAVLPFLSVIVSPETYFSLPGINLLIELLRLNHPRELLLPVTVIFILAALLAGTVRITLLWAQTKLSMAIGADFSIQVYERTLYQPYSLHLQRNSSEILAGIQKANAIVPQFIQPVLTILSSVLIIIAIVSALLALKPIMAISTFVGLGLIYSVVISVTRQRIITNSKTIAVQQSKVVKAIQEGLGGIRDVLIDGTQPVYSKIYRKAFIPMQLASATNQVIGASPRYGLEALGMALIAGLAYMLFPHGAQVDSLTSAIPVLGVLALGAQRLLPIFQQIYTAYIRIKGNYSSIQDALNLLDQPMPNFLCNSNAKPLCFSRAITFKEVGFRYTPDGPWVFRHINLEISIGNRVGILGITGGGKSTLLDIAMGLLPVTEGKIFIDNTPLTIANTRLWQAHIAHVPQVIFLTDATIAENIAFGVPIEDINFERLKFAASRAQIDKDIESWSEGYETLVGERGVRLSGGQRQRIGIARALYKEAKVIMLDEATSALDNATESSVIETLDKLGSDITVIIIAHRLTTLRNCNQILELNNGTLQFLGGYKQMIEIKNYANLTH